MESNSTELKCRGAYVIGIGPENCQNNKLFDEWITTPDLGIASPIASIIPIQLLAYHLAVLRGNDPDKPRNLAKSVTVKIKPCSRLLSWEYFLEITEFPQKNLHKNYNCCIMLI